ncbi:MSCRAMM family protein [Actinokineospora sp. HUAS TT18]|uniref:MSCRAMM family protein n=1 Tax=Actinokineospora sp. HUAS TT18 TaxID=3447451 RepID=UPI003F520914
MGSSLPARLIAATAGLAMTAVALVATAPAAIAAPQHGIGHSVSPAQPYKGNPDTSDWLGSYVVGGQHVWCVSYAYLAPDTDEQYQPGEPLKTKWGTELAPTVAADISYLLLRYTSTTSADEAAALAHLLHSWTAAPQTPDQLAPTNTFRTIAYDEAGHFAKLPASAKAAVDKLKADATANHGPWTVKITKPTKPQIIDTPDAWTVQVNNAAGKGVAGVAVALTLTDATAEGRPTLTVTTPVDGGPATVNVTPTGPNPKLAVSLASPADRPVVRSAVQVDTQRVVSTGGEKTLTGAEATTAVTAPGAVSVAKIDEKTGAGIAGVSLRITGADKVAPAVGQDGKPLVGADGKPTVVVTGADGTVKVPDLKTPQDICVIEVAAPAGYEQAFDPAAPPSACGTVKPGETLALKLVNKPNVPTVPKTIPAGDGPAVATAAVASSGPSTGLLVGLGALVLLVAGGSFAVARRRMPKLVVGRGMRKDWER